MVIFLYFYQLSVRKGAAGKSLELNKLPIRKFLKQYRTATGVATSWELTVTLLLSLLTEAFAGWNTLSAPANSKPLSSCPLTFRQAST